MGAARYVALGLMPQGPAQAQEKYDPQHTMLAINIAIVSVLKNGTALPTSAAIRTLKVGLIESKAKNSCGTRNPSPTLHSSNKPAPRPGRCTRNRRNAAPNRDGGQHTFTTTYSLLLLQEGCTFVSIIGAPDSTGGSESTWQDIQLRLSLTPRSR